MTHRNAPLSETGRLRLACCIVEDGWPLRRAAERFNVSVTTAQRWAQRYRAHGPAGMRDHSSRPHHQPRRVCRRTQRRVVGLRITHQWGPARIAYHLRHQHLSVSTVGKILQRYGCPPLTWIDKATGARLRAQATPVRYEHDTPGSLVHVDIKKLGRIPDGGGHRMVGRAQGVRNRGRSASGGGYHYIHNAVDDHSRLAYVEVLSDERKDTAAGLWTRAQAWFASQGITVAGPDRQRLLLPVQSLQQGTQGHPHHAQVHPALHAQDQRQGRAVQQDPGRRVGLRTALRQRDRPPGRTPRLAAPLQSPPRTHRAQRQITRRPRT